jgi:hypothetical protein
MICYEAHAEQVADINGHRTQALISSEACEIVLKYISCSIIALTSVALTKSELDLRGRNFGMITYPLHQQVS